MTGSIVWFRQDLRLMDNPALSAACSASDAILPVYILDKANGPAIGEAQDWWLHHSLHSLSSDLSQKQLALHLKEGQALAVLDELVEQHNISAIYWNRCYEPRVIERDKAIFSYFKEKGITVKSYNGSLLNEPWEIKTKTNDFYKVFTPYWKACLQQLDVASLAEVKRWPDLIKAGSDRLEDWNLLPSNPDWACGFADFWQAGEQAAHARLEHFLETALSNYDKARDFPAAPGTSHLSPSLHFGEISPKQIWLALQQLMDNEKTIPRRDAERFLAELGWREFSYHLLYHFPTLDNENFNRKFNAFPWQDDEELLRCWQKGQTGYPIVDAGMRELWQTGYMHNRVRMIVASFLTKDLLIPWQKGAQWFFNTLLDADLANNSAGWQWTAGSGADAAPYFRIFNPVTQSERFDPNGEYLKRWLPELENLSGKYLHAPWLAPANQRPSDYPAPIVDHAEARKYALMAYEKIK